MTFLILLGLFGGVIVLAFIGAIAQKLFHPGGYDVSAETVRADLKDILDGKDRALDDFISIGPLKDARLEQIRIRVGQLDQEFPSPLKNEYCNEDGLAIIKQYIIDLGADIARARTKE